MESNRPLGWTTIEEAKRLVDAGLDPNTADMLFENHYGETIVTVKPWTTKGRSIGAHIFPCWSLGALIGLMPKTIPHKRNKEKGKEYWNYSLLITTNTIYYGCHIINDSCYYLYDYFIDFKYDNCIVEASVNAVCWLLKNGYIKK